MGADVVQYDVEFGIPVIAQQLVHESDKLLGAVTLLDAGYNATSANLQGGVELDGPVSLVIVSAPLDLAGAHGQ